MRLRVLAIHSRMAVAMGLEGENREEAEARTELSAPTTAVGTTVALRDLRQIAALPLMTARFSLAGWDSTVRLADSHLARTSTTG